ncbi:reverse transcriptase domain-containing protein [Burkholderia sp. Bp9140]|uniref:reverse transcriptase domain-containing protein n=1 Tax=Burkholderia sp. Bp9140 TaxID=2184572 RepID=UPI0021AB1663|nr:reverse transcriptase domain-containing protein [Burkholderia sp. Bp9140]
MSIEAILEELARQKVFWFSTHVLGIAYSELKAIIYPQPPYKHFTIKKRNGTDRVILEPRKRLKIIQEKVLAYLQNRAGSIKPAVHGFVRKRSILTNAQAHCSPKNHHVFNIDLEDFFPSITFYRVRGVLEKQPFNFSHEVATVIAHICTLDKKLPQGAPTSPFLSNMVCRTMDRDLADLARRNLARYTRYADDITFSFPVRKTSRLPAAICRVDDDGDVLIGTELHDLIANKHHFKVNSAKTRLSDRTRRMEVTGLTINRFPNVPRIFIDRVRGALHAWEKYDYAAASKVWSDRVVAASTGPYEKKPWKRQTRSGKVPELKNVLWGKLLYVRMVRGKDDLIYTRLAERYNAAVLKTRAAGPFVAPRLPVEPVVRDKTTAREACFVVEWWGDYQSAPGHTDDIPMGQGTAFVYRELNLLVTCNHVFEGVATVNKHSFNTDFDAPEMVNKTLTLVQPSTKQSWPAKILYRNPQMDFALLAFEDPPSHRYFSAMDCAIESGAQGILIGFPAYQQWNLPDFNEQKVLNRTLPNAGMISFTLSNSGSVRPGNSGGPFTDDRFRVAGMAQRGAYMGTGHDECLCMEVIDALISEYKATLASSAPVTPASALDAAPIVAPSGAVIAPRTAAPAPADPEGPRPPADA